MKRILIGWIAVPLLLALAACGNNAAATANASGSLSPEAELVVGSLKLEKTNLAITADQAKQLLPLWQTLQTLSSSSTAATEEINALVDQIKSAMTTQQIDKIASMKLTQQDMMTAMADAGAGLGGPSGTPNATPGANEQFFAGGPDSQGGGGPSFNSGPSGSGGPSGGGPSGSGPSGAPPSGGFVIQGGPDGGGTAPGQSSTPQAVRGNGFANLIPAPLLNALIQTLQKKAQ